MSNLLFVERVRLPVMSAETTAPDERILDGDTPRHANEPGTVGIDHLTVIPDEDEE